MPLPDVVLSVEEIDFGDVQVGQKGLENFGVWNAGEARAKVTFVSSSPDLFPAWDPAADVESGVTFDSAVRFLPTKNGPFEATLFVASNDPSDPVQKIILKGTGFGGPETPPATVEQDGSCACRFINASSGKSNDQAMMMFGLLMGITSLRRAARVKINPLGSKVTHTKSCKRSTNGSC